MKNKITKNLLVVILLVVAFIFTGCSNTEENNTSNKLNKDQIGNLYINVKLTKNQKDSAELSWKLSDGIEAYAFSIENSDLYDVYAVQDNGALKMPSNC